MITKIPLKEVEKVLMKNEKDLEEYQKTGKPFQVNNVAETVARCYRILGNEQKSIQYFKIAAEAAIENIARLEKKGVKVRVAQLFEALWLYLQAEDSGKVEEICDRILNIVETWQRKVLPLFERILLTLSLCSAGDDEKAKQLYNKYDFQKRCERKGAYPEIMILRAILYDDPEAAHSAIKLSNERIKRSDILPWYNNQIEFDIIRMAEDLLKL
ncbi:MAG: hypothetical protein PHS44_03960 [Candidatus Dojkabacteria bacterium]|nr:hypothetical protein [Candidatus Dojkabacteria bacterium]